MVSVVTIIGCLDWVTFSTPGVSSLDLSVAQGLSLQWYLISSSPFYDTLGIKEKNSRTLKEERNQQFFSYFTQATNPISGVSSPPTSPGQISNVDHMVLPGQVHQLDVGVSLRYPLGIHLYLAKPSDHHQVLGEKAIALERIWAFASDTIQPILFILFFIVQVPFKHPLIY